MNPIDDLINSFDNFNINYTKIFNVSKLAYPNEDYTNIKSQRDVQKWLNAVKEIYNREQNGENKVFVIRKVTSEWNIIETFDFLNWIKFYESGSHMKYKFAKLWYENDSLGPGYFLEMNHKNTEPEKTVDIDATRDQAIYDAEKKQTIERHRNKIIGRLDSAEKLLRSQDGHTFSGKEFESLLESIYQLKKKIQMVNKLSSSTRLYEDMIVREANVLAKKGFIKASDSLYALAQTPGQSGEAATGRSGNSESSLTPASPGDPSGAGNPGAPGGLPSMGPGMPQQAPSSATPNSVENNPPSKGIEEFLTGLNKDQYSPRDSDTLEVQDNADVLEVNDVLEVREEDGVLVSKGQMMPKNPMTVDEPITTSPAPAKLDPAPVKTPTTEDLEEFHDIQETLKPKPVKPSKPKAPKLEGKDIPDSSPELEIEDVPELEVTEEDIPEAVEPYSTSNFDAKVDAVFSDITIADVVTKFEYIAKIFKTREVSRELAVADMMLNGLGISSYFGELAECISKNLDSTNYCDSRINIILSKLHGALTSNVKPKPPVERPEMQAIKSKLQEDEDRENNRKQLRKEKETAKLEELTKPTPDIEIEEDLASPQSPNQNVV